MKNTYKIITLLLITIALVADCNHKPKKGNTSGVTALLLNNIGSGTYTCPQGPAGLPPGTTMPTSMNPPGAPGGSDKYFYGSVVQMTRADVVNVRFTGVCYDTFTLYNTVPTSAFNFFTTPAGGSCGTFNSDLVKWNVSTSSCAALGFTNGTAITNTAYGTTSPRPNTQNSFYFKSYTCDPNNSPCSSTQIKAAGF